MRHRIALTLLFLFLLAVGSFHAPSSPVSLAQEAPAGASATLKVSGAVSTPLVLTVDDLKKMPRKTLSVLNPHDKKTENYEGVLVEELLKKAGVPQGENLRGASLAAYVLFEAEDGYRVVFSIAELDSGIADCGVMVADTLDGKALPAKVGPFRLVAPLEKRPARWVRMLKSITVVRVPSS
jgi:DMSO/TMAO reductase YedYZ molybdopterin-dependent catalytic subunit